MPRPRVYGSRAEQEKAYRERKAKAQHEAGQQCVSLVDAVREQRQAWLRLPVEFRPDDVEFADPVETVRLVTALLDRISEGRLFDKPTEEIRYAEPGPVSAQQVTKRRRKNAGNVT